MRIGIVACETFERALEAVIKDDPNIVHKEYLEFGLHTYPDKLRATVVDKVNALEGKVDAVLLAYGICNSLKDVTDELLVPSVRLQADDCIGVMITPQQYEVERKRCAGTFYHTPYFAKMGREWFENEVRSKMPDFEELGLDLDWYLDQLFGGYARVLFIDDGLEGIEVYEGMSRRFAEERKLRFERRHGTLSMLAQGLAMAKELARASSAL
jgi:hypothetical protein